jgi:AAA+ superfamily predicted ATPase
VVTAPALVLDPAQQEALETLARVLLGDAPSLVIVEGTRGTGRTCAIARAVGGQVVEVDLASSNALVAGRREAALRDRALVLANFDRGSEADQRTVRAVFQHHPGPVIVTASVLGAQLPLDRPTIRVRWPVPSTTVRRQLWLDAGASSEGIDALAHRYRIGPGTIARAIESARLLGGATATLDPASLTTGLRHNISEELGGLAQRVEVTQTWDDLVLAEDTRDQVDALIARVQHAHKVLEDWDYRGKMARGTGVPALFSGPPGTGKTMVAGLIARALDLELYQVDLSQVISKWVGETEKQLARVFDAAEQGHGLLLFDEADALFGQRTSEVKGAVDRYANLEVNYLLQRVEAFGGITILTTNMDASIDPALMRRLAAHVKFWPPEHDERVLLWRGMLGGANVPLAADVDYEELSTRFPDMTGANIRNAALAGAFLAAAEGTDVSQQHLGRAARGEYASMGRSLSGATR